jgi:hypothetical protein
MIVLIAIAGFLGLVFRFSRRFPDITVVTPLPGHANGLL